MDVGKRITELRKAKGITTNKLANNAGISQSHIREVELGTRNPTVETLSYICEALGVSLVDFFNDGIQINPSLYSAAKKLTDDQQKKLADYINSMLGEASPKK